LGKCIVDHSVLYKSDIRGDELKRKGDTFEHDGMTILLEDDESIRIRDSFLIKTLVHNFSHDPENPEEFLIQNTVAAHYSNIHGSPVEGCFLGAFATVDLTTLHSCNIGAFSYVQAGDLYHQNVEPGTIWIKSDKFEFKYVFPKEILKEYISFEPGLRPQGIIMDFVESRKDDFKGIYDIISCDAPVSTPSNTALNRYAYVTGDTQISENVLVSQRAYLDNAWMGPGTNAQENAYIINSRLEKNDITAHGGKIINSKLEEKVFVGFNSFIRGDKESPLKIGAGSIIMPHTIIDLKEPLEIAPESIVWGINKNKEDLKENSMSLAEFKKIDNKTSKGSMVFSGSGSEFVHAFLHRIDHILEANGAFYEKMKIKGHAQEGNTIAFNIIQPYLTGRYKGLYPTMDIKP